MLVNGRNDYLKNNFYNMIKEIEKKANKILTKFNLKTVPVDVEEIATRHNIKISRAPSKEFSGLLLRKDGVSLIGVNSKEVYVRQRFTIAHELGHYFMHPQKDTFVDYRKEDVKKTLKESQADKFAAALLMPQKNVEEDFKKLSKNLTYEEIIKILSSRYEVSMMAMNIRLRNLGLRFYS